MGPVASQADLQKKYERALVRDPGDAEALNFFAIQARNQGRIDDAINFCIRGTQAHPNVAEFHANLGEFSRLAGKMDQAIRSLERAIALRPTEPTFNNALGTVLASSRRFTEAEALFRRAIELNPKYADAHNNLGAALRELDRLTEAEQSIREAIQLAPNFASAYSNLSIVLMDLERFEEAIENLRRAIAIRPDYRAAHFNLGMIYLLLGNFKEGWAEYQWRPVPTLPTRQPIWRGEDLRGKTIFLHGEQGIGDTIQFVRYVPILRAMGAAIILGAHPELEGLLTPMARFLRRGEMFPQIDFYCPLMNIPIVVGADASNIPGKAPYLHADPALAASWRELMGLREARVRVGLVWAGRAAHADDARRSIPLEKFAPLLNVPNVQFFSLQVGPSGAGAAERGLVDLTQDLRNFSDTAALIEHLDLVIAVDTSVAHLAGAMGKPTWLLLARIPDWRWMLNRLDTPWYPTMRLFRQQRRGDWDSVIRDVAQNLPAMAGAKA